MKTNKKYYYLLVIGIVITNIDFILKHYITISDTWVGLLKGLGIGIMITSVYLITKHKRSHNQSCMSGE